MERTWKLLLNIGSKVVTDALLVPGLGDCLSRGSPAIAQRVFALTLTKVLKGLAQKTGLTSWHCCGGFNAAMTCLDQPLNAPMTTTTKPLVPPESIFSELSLRRTSTPQLMMDYEVLL